MAVLDRELRDTLKAAVDSARRAENGLDLKTALQRARAAELKAVRYRHEAERLRQQLASVRKQRDRYRYRIMTLERRLKTR